jgi:hypothetical protein
MRIPARDGPTKTVILSGVNAPRSEAFTQSKEPMPACSSTGTARRSNHALYEAPREFLAVFVALITGTARVGRTLLSECPFKPG